MKRIVFFLPLISFLLSGSTQQIREESLVINVEVPVRVFQGSNFAGTLTADDFELYEDGVLQKIEAMYLVKNRAIEKREEEKKFMPQTTRNFYLVFELTNYVPQIDEALRYFVYNVIVPSDNIVIVTPLKTYRVLAEAIAAKTKEDILRQFIGILRRDATVSATEYRDLVTQLENLSRAMSQQLAGNLSDTSTDALLRLDQFATSITDGRTIHELLQIYADVLAQLDNIRTLDQKKLLGFSDYLKKIEGQKYIFLFYEREFVPKIDPKILYQYIDLYQDRPELSHMVTGLFEFYKREFLFNPELIKQAFADASISSHFLFITSPAEVIAGVRLEEHSEDIYSVFREIARSNGGFLDSSASPADLMRNAVEAAENYYVLYYSPQKFIKDGKFKEITVRVKKPRHKVIHRLGYFSR